MQLIQTTGGYPANDKIKYKMNLSYQFYYVSLTIEAFITIIILFLFFLSLWNICMQQKKSTSSSSQNQLDQKLNKQKQHPFEKQKDSQISLNNGSDPISSPQNKILPSQTKMQKQDIAIIQNKLKLSNNEQFVSNHKKDLKKRNINSQQVEQAQKQNFNEQKEKKQLKKQLKKQQNQIIRFADNVSQISSIQRASKHDTNSSKSNSEDESQQSQQSKQSSQNKSDKISIDLQNLSNMYSQTNYQQQTKPKIFSDQFHEMGHNFQQQNQFQEMNEEKRQLRQQQEKFLRYERKTIYLVCSLIVVISIIGIARANLMGIYGLAPSLLVFIFHNGNFIKRMRWTLNFAFVGLGVPMISLITGSVYLS